MGYPHSRIALWCCQTSQAVVLDEVLGDEDPRHASIAICRGMDMREPVVEPRCDQQGVVDAGLREVLAVLRKQVVESRVDVFGRAVLVDYAVGPGWIVGHGLEGAGS